MKSIDENVKLKGVSERSEFGFLTVFEHLKYLEVGKNLKFPLLPIWILCKEFHYSVLFAKDSRANYLTTKKFDLVFFDELCNYEDQIILTVENNKSNNNTYTNVEDDDLTPLIE